jgi:hypothetical protein
MPICRYAAREKSKRKQGGPPGMRQGRLIATSAMLAFCLFAIWQSLLLPLTDRLGPALASFRSGWRLIGTGAGPRPAGLDIPRGG